MKLFKKKTETSESEIDENQEETESSTPKTGPKRGMPLVDFFMRILAAVATLGSAIAMGNIHRTLPIFASFIRFKAKYDDLPTFTFFVVANGIACGYLVLSLPLSIFHILKPGAGVTRAILIIFDTIMLAFLTSGASAAAAIAHLAHKGNARANWVAICQQYNSFCERVSGSLVGSFIGIFVLMLLIFFSAIALSRN